MLSVPFLQDDFKFLEHAALSSRAGRAPAEDFFSQTMPHFWRPISVTLYWRFVNGVLGASAVAAHGLNLLLVGLAAAAVGGLAAALIRDQNADGAKSAGPAFTAALLYGIHGAFFLPAAWVSAAQESIALIFSALFLLLGVEALGTRARHTVAGASVLPFLFAAALLCKEGTAVLPVLLAILVLGRRHKAASWYAWFAGTMFLLLSVLAAWFLTRRQFTDAIPPDSPYAIELGFNTLRNASALILFGLNLPREVFPILESAGSHFPTMTWGAVCLVLQVSALWLLLRSAGKTIRPGWSRALLFSATAIAPYLALAWNCYPYYALLALMPYAFLAAQAAASGARRQLITACALAVASSTVYQCGQWIAGYPAPIARAEWGEQQRRKLQNSAALSQAVRNAAVVDVLVTDTNRFGAAGSVPGIASSLGIASDRIRVREGNMRAMKPDAPVIIQFSGEGMEVLRPPGVELK
jgi:hypothetical protein